MNCVLLYVLCVVLLMLLGNLVRNDENLRLSVMFCVVFCGYLFRFVVLNVVLIVCVSDVFLLLMCLRMLMLMFS